MGFSPYVMTREGNTFLLLPKLEDYKRENNLSDQQFEQYLNELLARNGMLSSADFKFISRYLKDDDRYVLIEDNPDGISNIYLGTSMTDPAACYISFKPGFIEIHEARYEGVGCITDNNSIQAGTVRFKRYTIDNWPKSQINKVLKVKVTDTKREPELILFSDTYGYNVEGRINIDPNTLHTCLGSTIYDEVGGPLTLLKRRFIQGENNMNLQRVVRHASEDWSFLEEFRKAEKKRI